MPEGESSSIGGRAGVDGLAVLNQREVVDARAFQRDRAFQARRVDRDARACGEHRRAGLHLRGRRGLAGRLRCCRLAGGGRGRAGRGVVAGEGVCCWVCCCFSSASWRCRSICGPAMKYCQPSSTSAESAMAMIVFLLSVMGCFRPRPVCVASVQARHRARKFRDHPAKRHGERCLAADQHVVMSGLRQKRGMSAHEVAQSPPHPVAHNRIADLARDREAEPSRGTIAPFSCLQHERPGRNLRALGGGEEIRPLLQTLHWVCRCAARASGAEPLASTRAPGAQHLAATFGGEAGAETVTALAHQFARLIGPFHG